MSINSLGEINDRFSLQYLSTIYSYRSEQLAYHLVEDPERALFNEFAKMHVPRIYLVDTKGNVRYQDVNWHPFMLEDMQEAVDCLLQKPS